MFFVVSFLKFVEMLNIFYRIKRKKQIKRKVGNARRKMIMEKGLSGYIREMEDSVGGEWALMESNKTTAETRKEGQNKDFKQHRGVGEGS